MAERQAQEQELARAARAEQAAADADLAKVQAMLDQAQEQAAHELAEQRRRSDEYQRLLKMDSRSLLAEVRRMRDRLPSVPDLMSRDHEYTAALGRAQHAGDQLEQAQAAQAQAAQAVEDWRDGHRLRTWAHDRGVLAGPLVTLEGRVAEAAERVQELTPLVRAAQRRLARQHELSERAALGQLVPHRESLDGWHARALKLQDQERKQGDSRGRPSGRARTSSSAARPRHRGM